MPAVVWTVDLLASTPPLILFAASAPALLLATLVLIAQRGYRRTPRALALALLWGGIGAACLASIGNESARPWMATLAGDGARTATALLIAPTLEESAKALGLLLLLAVFPGSLRNARDGVVYGALIGVGFVWTENFLYLGVSMLQGGEQGLERALYLRGILDGIAHMVFTASSGAALGWWFAGAPGSTAARIAPAAGLLLAIAQHALWNGLAAPSMVSVLCGASASGGACTDQPSGIAVFGASTLIAAIFLVPGIALARVAWRSGSPDATGLT